jgi:hypothetical protein
MSYCFERCNKTNGSFGVVALGVVASQLWHFESTHQDFGHARVMNKNSKNQDY